MTGECVRLISYAQPPLVEVVCGVLFEPLESLLMPHIGRLWELFRDDYPVCSERDHLLPVVEEYGDGPRELLAEMPSRPRAWFTQEEETRIIQVQRDRFLHNWKRYPADAEYPRYETLIVDFDARYGEFRSFLDEHGLGTPRPLQYELTYVNHLVQGDGWTSLNDIGSVLPDLSWRDVESRFLPDAEGLFWKAAFRLPSARGRLHVQVVSVKRQEDGQPTLRLDLTVRGMGRDISESVRRDWFDEAHEWIVRGFADLTDEGVQTTLWGKIDDTDC